MKILFLNPVGVLGGAERVLLDIFAPLQRAEPGIELRLLTGTDGPLVSKARELGVRTDVLPMPASLAALGEHGVDWKDPKSVLRGGAEAALYANRLARAIRDINPSIVHSNGMKTHLLSSFATPRNTSLVWHLHDFLGDRPLASHFLRASSRFASAAVANSHAVARDASRVLGSRLRIEVIYNGVDVDHYCPGNVDASLLDRRAGGGPPQREGTIRVGLVATFARWKGHKVFLEAAANVVARGLPQPTRFYIVGGPIYRTPGSQFSEAELREEARRLDIAEHVVFVPFQEDLSDIYRSLDVVVHASTRREPFGMVIAEAMSTGRAVVVANAGGACELFTHDEDALGYDAGNARAFADAVATLVADRAHRERLGGAARRTAVARFARERLGGELATIYRSVLKSLASGDRS